MSWVNRKRRFGCHLALVGLALQLILSFGHVHLDGLSGGSAAVRAATAIVPGSQPSPAHHPTNDAGDYCAICATIHLTSTSSLSYGPQLAAPFVAQAIEHFDQVAFLFVAPRRTAFQSRAPPLD